MTETQKISEESSFNWCFTREGQIFIRPDQEKENWYSLLYPIDGRENTKYPYMFGYEQKFDGQILIRTNNDGYFPLIPSKAAPSAIKAAGGEELVAKAAIEAYSTYIKEIEDSFSKTRKAYEALVNQLAAQKIQKSPTIKGPSGKAMLLIWAFSQAALVVMALHSTPTVPTKGSKPNRPNTQVQVAPPSKTTSLQK